MAGEKIKIVDLSRKMVDLLRFITFYVPVSELTL